MQHKIPEAACILKLHIVNFKKNSLQTYCTIYHNLANYSKSPTYIKAMLERFPLQNHVQNEVGWDRSGLPKNHSLSV